MNLQNLGLSSREVYLPDGRRITIPVGGVGGTNAENIRVDPRTVNFTGMQGDQIGLLRRTMYGDGQSPGQRMMRLSPDDVGEAMPGAFIYALDEIVASGAGVFQLDVQGFPSGVYAIGFNDPSNVLTHISNVQIDGSLITVGKVKMPTRIFEDDHEFPPEYLVLGQCDQTMMADLTFTGAGTATAYAYVVGESVQRMIRSAFNGGTL